MPWAPAYASAAELASWLGVPEDPELALACESASRAIDLSCNRQFGLLSSSEFRWYTAIFIRDRWVIPVDDFMTEASLTIEVDNDGDGTPEAEITDYRLTPVNSAAIGRPWTAIEVLPSSTLKPNGCRHSVRVSARWGWSAIPNAVKLATLMQAALLHERRTNVAGRLTTKEVDDVRYGWAASGATELDPDVMASIIPYRRLWAAA